MHGMMKMKTDRGSFSMKDAYPRDNSSANGKLEMGKGGGEVTVKTGPGYGRESGSHTGGGGYDYPKNNPDYDTSYGGSGSHHGPNKSRKYMD